MSNILTLDFEDWCFSIMFHHGFLCWLLATDVSGRVERAACGHCSISSWISVLVFR